MKKALAILLSALILIGFASCGQPAGQPEAEETTAAQANSRPPLLIINDEPCVITAQDGFDNAGVTALVGDASAAYSF